MPTYDYACNACGHTFELFQSITAKPIKKCPSCKKSSAKRLIGTGASIIFKGSGFYQTDYRSEGYKKAAKAEADAQSPKKSEKSDTTSTSASPKKDGGSKSNGTTGS